MYTGYMQNHVILCKEHSILEFWYLGGMLEPTPCGHQGTALGNREKKMEAREEKGRLSIEEICFQERQGNLSRRAAGAL